MILNIFWLILGLILILGGANFLTDGASALAKKWGMSDFTVGLTVVAFGTSAPELCISVISAISGNTGLALGNVVGSNIFNICMIIGITALIYPIKVEKSVLNNDIPFVVLSSVLILALGCKSILDPGTSNIVTRVDGIILLIFFLIFLRYTFGSSAPEHNAEQLNVQSEKPKQKTWLLWVMTLGGLAALLFGGDKFVDGASNLALGLGISESIVGLTIVSMGTSFPELATSIVAARKGKSDLAVGNVIGSNLFNIFFVLGCSAVITPIPFGNIGLIDTSTLLLASILFWFFGWKIKHRTITRPEGAVLVLLYAAYLVYLIV